MPTPRTVVVTGSASGIGAAVAERLRDQGDRVIGVDRAGGEVVADLSTPQGRAQAAQAVLDLAGGHLDGAVLCAGLGPMPGAERTILEVNARGVIELLETWRPALAAGSAQAVLIGSNSTTTTPFVSRKAVRETISGDLDRAERRLRPKKMAPPLAYATSKLAVSYWAREQAVRPEWVGAGIRLNVLAPGATMTPMLREQLAGPQGRAVRNFPIPAGAPAEPGELADIAVFMVSPAARAMVGSVVFADGGTDALLRGDHAPAPVKARQLGRYGAAMVKFRRR